MTDISEFSIINNKKILIISFGGSLSKIGGILPFEFLRYLNTNYKKTCDLMFFIDKNKCWYHKGITGISNNIPETKIYIENKIKDKYDKIIFIGVSAGGYAAILFGSLCNVDHVIAFNPQTYLENPIDEIYRDIKKFINNKTKYLLFGQTDITDQNDIHNIKYCEHLKEFDNVKIIKKENFTIPNLRDTGELKYIIDNIIKI
jgi:predicted esterase YcpF (UPF0227 family)